MNTSNNRALVDRYIAAYNAFDIDGMLALLTSDVVFQNFSGDQLTASTSGIDEFRKLAEQAKSLFSEREQRVTAFREDADHAVANIAYRGRLASDIPNSPSAGEVLELQGESVFSFTGGKISKIVDRS